MIKSAVVDTTVITDAILKDCATRKRTKESLARYDETQTPQYALKEFIGGPLRAYAWLHNVLLREASFIRALGRLNRRVRSPARNQGATAIEAWQRAAEDAMRAGRRFGLPEDQETATRLRFHLWHVIMSGYRRAHTVTTRVTHPLRCFPDAAPVEKQSGMIKLGPQRCPKTSQCDMIAYLKTRRSDIATLIRVLSRSKPSPENSTRLKALDALYRDEQFTEHLCRGLGDAVFAILAPQKAVILTTNIRDHEPLAEALGKRVERP